MVPFLGKSQQLPTESGNPKDLYNNRNYSVALGYLLAQYQKHPSNDLILKIADSYRHIQNYKEAEIWYEKAVALPKVSSETRFYYAEALQSNEKYLKAIKQYLLTKPKGAVMQRLNENRIFSCQYADSILRAPLRFYVQNESAINTSYSEFGVVPYGNGNIIVSDRPSNPEELKTGIPKNEKYGWTDRGYLHLFLGKGDSTKINVPLNVFEDIVKTDFHIGPIVFNKAQDLVFFTITHQLNISKLKNRFTKNDELVNRLEVYLSHKVNGVWQKAVPFPFNSNAYSVGHPAISPDQKYLYFASDMPGGIGGIDLYYSQILPNDAFGKPVNLGNTINTEGNEEFPVFQPNGVLYFCSDGLIGLGGLDLFRTRGEMTHWMLPDNLGYPLNHSSDDFGFITERRDSIAGFFASNRDEGKGVDDIYRFLQIKPLPPLLRAKGDTSITDSVKEVEFEKKTFPSDSIEYIATYQLKNIPVPFVIDSARIKDTLLARFLKSKYVYHLPKAENDLNHFELDSLTLNKIDSLAKLLRDHPNLNLDIIGHTDSRGSEGFNQQLSEKRAKAAYDRFITLGIPPNRLSSTGVGSSKPVVDCEKKNCADSDHAANRRTEFLIKGIGSSFAFDDSDRAVSTDTTIFANRQKLYKIVRNLEVQKALKRVHEAYMAAFHKANPKLEMEIAQRIGIVGKLDARVGQLRARREVKTPRNELFDAFSEMSIQNISLTPRNILVIQETDGTIQRILMPGRLLGMDQSITDVDGREWVIHGDRRVEKVRDKTRQR